MGSFIFQKPFFLFRKMNIDYTVVYANPTFRKSVEDRVQSYLHRHLDDSVELSMQRKLPTALNMILMSHGQTQSLLETVRHRIEQDSQRVISDIARQNIQENPVFTTLMSRIHINNDVRLTEFEKRTTERLNEEVKDLRKTNLLLGVGVLGSLCLAGVSLCCR